MAVSLPLRDALMWGLVPLLRTRGYSSLPVHFLGKAATFALMSGLPLVLLGQFDALWSRIILACGWAFLIWGMALYLWSAVLYVAQVVLVVRRLPRVSGIATANRRSGRDG